MSPKRKNNSKTARGKSVANNNESKRHLAPGTKLFIGGLSYDTTDASLARYFENFGPVSSAVVLRDSATLRSRGFGFVTFDIEEAARAVLNCQHHVVDGREVEAKPAVPRIDRNGSGESDTGVANVPNNIPSNTGCHKAEKHEASTDLGGESPVSPESHRSWDSRSSLGWSVAGVQAALPLQNGKELGEPRFCPETGSSLGENNSTYTGRSSIDSNIRSSIVPNKIFVGGLLYATANESLAEYFSQYGPVETAEVIYNRDTKKSRGFGFVIFKHFDAVRAVLSQQEGRRHVIDGKQVEVKLCKARQDQLNDEHYNVNMVSTGFKVHSDMRQTLKKAPVKPEDTRPFSKRPTPVTSFAQAAAVGTPAAQLYQQKLALNDGVILKSGGMYDVPGKPVSSYVSYDGTNGERMGFENPQSLFTSSFSGLPSVSEISFTEGGKIGSKLHSDHLISEESDVSTFFEDDMEPTSPLSALNRTAMVYDPSKEKKTVMDPVSPRFPASYANSWGQVSKDRRNSTIGYVSSVEFPVVGQQVRGSRSYSISNEALAGFDGFSGLFPENEGQSELKNEGVIDSGNIISSFEDSLSYLLPHLDLSNSDPYFESGTTQH